MRCQRMFWTVVLIIGAATILSGCSGTRGPRPEIVFFYVDDCHKCARMKDVLSDLLVKYPAVTVQYYEMEASQSFLWKLARRHNLGTNLDVPMIFVGDHVVVGEGRQQELALRSAIEACATEGCRSP